MGNPPAAAEPRTTSVIPTSSLRLGTTGWTGRHGKPRRARSADWESLAGPIWENTQIYEGTNQIQRVVIAKKLLGLKVLDQVEGRRSHGSTDLSLLHPYLSSQLCDPRPIGDPASRMLKSGFEDGGVLGSLESTGPARPTPQVIHPVTASPRNCGQPT